MTHEDICTLEQSKALRRLGFDWHCHRLYNTFDALIGEVSPFYSNEGFDNMPLAPTMAQAAKWLRERYNLHIHVYLYLDDCWRFEVQDVNDLDKYVYEPSQGLWWRTYEEALSKGIDRALEILKEEKK